MSGLTLKLIKASVMEMLDTLSDDDYVNVARVSFLFNYSSLYTFIPFVNNSSESFCRPHLFVLCYISN